MKYMTEDIEEARGLRLSAMKEIADALSNDVKYSVELKLIVSKVYEMLFTTGYEDSFFKASDLLDIAQAFKGTRIAMYTAVQLAQFTADIANLIIELDCNRKQVCTHLVVELRELITDVIKLEIDADNIVVIVNNMKGRYSI